MWEIFKGKPRVAEAVTLEAFKALKVEVAELRGLIEAVELDWARQKTQLRRLAGQITKAAALDRVIPVDQPSAPVVKPRTADDMTREEIAALQLT